MRIGIIGDSQSQGLVPWLVPLLEARGDVVVGTMAVPGMSLQNMRASNERASAAREIAARSDELIVILGGNNPRDPEAKYAHLVDWFLTRVAQGPRRIWWVGPAASTHDTGYDRHVITRRYQRALLPRRARVTWIDAWPMTARGVQFAADGLHFTREGYRVWASRLVGELEGTPTGLLIGGGLLGFAVGLFLAISRR